MRTTEKILWLLVGASIGAGIALLYAPKTGRETRKYIRRRAEDASGQLRDTLAETRESVIEAGREAYKKGADFASGAAESAAGLFERGRKRVTS
jgi:gas vesicle protein